MFYKETSQGNNLQIQERHEIFHWIFLRFDPI